MSSITGRTTALVALALGLSGLTPASDDWELLQQLQRGDRVRVQVRRQPDVRGEFATITPAGLQLAGLRNQQIDLRRADIRRVYLVRKRSRARAAAPWIGAAAGFGLGFAAGWGVGESSDCMFLCIGAPKPAAGAIVGLAFAGVGGVVGKFVPAKTERLIYRAP